MAKIVVSALLTVAGPKSQKLKLVESHTSQAGAVLLVNQSQT